MSGLSLRLAKVLAIGMVLAIVAVIGLTLAEGVANASPQATAVAKLTAALLARGGNDTVTQIYAAAPNPQVRAEMRRGAQSYCGGQVYEDFSCPGGSHAGQVRAEDGSWVPANYYSKTDYRPVRAAVGH